MPFDPEQKNLVRLGTLVADASSSVVFVVGAGLSVAAGIPLWSELNERLIRYIEVYQKKVAIYDEKTLTSIIKDLRGIKNAWNLGDQLKGYLPRHEYERAIQTNLEGSSPPAAYGVIWGMNPAGVISLNLDRLAEIAHPGDAQDRATALDHSRYERFLLSRKPFLFQPHGRLRDSESWVLGTEARNRLLKNVKYKQFIRSLLHCKRLVFCGVRPDDLAVQTLLFEDFRDSETGLEHFWLLDQPSMDERAFAKNNHMLLVEYQTSGSHGEMLDILRLLANSSPRPLTTRAVYNGPTIRPEDLPDEEQLIREPAQSIRLRLNAALKYISEHEPVHEDRIEKIRKFYESYAKAVSIAWTVDTGKNSHLWGTTIEKLIGDGAFGTVYRAVDDTDGRVHAVKLLHQRVSTSADFLEAFQRGTEALRILTQKNMQGVVKFHFGYDVPACIFMEYIEGIDFQGAIEGRRLVTNLQTSLFVVEVVADIVNRGHSADCQILHRDLKPANIMIQTPLESSRANIDVEDIVVLDFDLSWYEGAAGKSVMSGARLHNYIAPEQLASKRGSVSSRVPAVDVFGAGMLLLFAVTRTEPSLGVQNSGSFLQDTTRMIVDAWSPRLLFVPRFLAVLIQAATYTEQSKRLSMPALIAGVRLVRDAVASYGTLVPSMAILEIEAILESRAWKSCDTLSLDTMALRRLVLDSGRLELSVVDLKGGAHVGIVLEFSNTGAAVRKEADARLSKGSDEAAAILRRGDLMSTTANRVAGGQVHIDCVVNDPDLTFEQVLEVADRVYRAVAHMKRMYGV